MPPDHPLAPTKPVKDRRDKERYPVDSTALLWIYPSEMEKSFTVRIVDVSTTGLCFESQQRFATGTGVRLHIHDGVAYGEVCYCEPAGSGLFRCGVDVITYR